MHIFYPSTERKKKREIVRERESVKEIKRGRERLKEGEREKKEPLMGKIKLILLTMLV